MHACLCSSPDCRVNGCAAARRPQDDLGRLAGVYRDAVSGAPARLIPDPMARVGVSRSKTPVGWECPRCRAILAPHVDRCTCPKPTA